MSSLSLKETLQNHVETIVSKFIDLVSEKHGIDKEKLFELWGEKNVKPSGKPAKPTLGSVDTDDLSHERLLKSTKPELSSLCKMKGLKCTGVKDELIARLLGTNPPEKKAKGEKKEKVEKKVEKKNDSRSASEVSDVIKNLTSKIPVIAIRKNAHGNLEHPSTGLVFDKNGKICVGKQKDDGKVEELNDDDIQTCRQYKFEFKLPDNLDKNNMEDIKIEELEESDIEIVKHSDDEEEIEVESDEEEIVE